MNYIKILYCDRINISEGTDVNKRSESKGCNICHYWYFLKRFKIQSHVCNGLYELLMMSMNLNEITI